MLSNDFTQLMFSRVKGYKGSGLNTFCIFRIFNGFSFKQNLKAQASGNRHMSNCPKVISTVTEINYYLFLRGIFFRLQDDRNEC